MDSGPDELKKTPFFLVANCVSLYFWHDKTCLFKYFIQHKLSSNLFKQTKQTTQCWTRLSTGGMMGLDVFTAAKVNTPQAKTSALCKSRTRKTRTLVDYTITKSTQKTNICIFIFIIQTQIQKVGFLAAENVQTSFDDIVKKIQRKAAVLFCLCR